MGNEVKFYYCKTLLLYLLFVYRKAFLALPYKDKNDKSVRIIPSEVMEVFKLYIKGVTTPRKQRGIKSTILEGENEEEFEAQNDEPDGIAAEETVEQAKEAFLARRKRLEDIRSQYTAFLRNLWECLPFKINVDSDAEVRLFSTKMYDS